jgi:hypothetical protein
LTQWRAFVSRNGLEGRKVELGQVVGELAGFVAPPMFVVEKNEGFEGRWEAGKP